MSEDSHAELQSAHLENDKYDWELIGERAVQHFMDMFVLPEISRRQQAGELPVPFGLTAAQVVFFPDHRPRIVRLNTEVKAVAKIALHEEVTKQAGDVVYEHEINSMEGLELSNEDDPDCGHMTLIKMQGRWFLGFDFFYNKALARRHIERAKEFVQVADFAASQNLLNAFIDAAFSAAELIAKSQELQHGDSDFRAKANHKAIAVRYNRSAHWGNVNSEYAAALNRLQRLRGAARYLQGDLDLTPDEAQELLKTIRAMQEAAERRLPKVGG